MDDILYKNVGLQSEQLTFLILNWECVILLSQLMPCSWFQDTQHTEQEENKEEHKEENKEEHKEEQKEEEHH